METHIPIPWLCLCVLAISDWSDLSDGGGQGDWVDGGRSGRVERSGRLQRLERLRRDRSVLLMCLAVCFWFGFLSVSWCLSGPSPGLFALLVASCPPLFASLGQVRVRVVVLSVMCRMLGFGRSIFRCANLNGRRV